ncbi:MAG: dTMP kinase [Candidatus Goldiibacteriota bacterium]
MRGKLIVFEGPEGCGKTTQVRKTLSFLRKKGVKAVHLREPGGNVISEKIRDIILDPKHKKMCAKTEMLLYVAARAQIIEEKLMKLLKEGKVVLLDRFYPATVVYQGYARGLDKGIIDTLNRYVLGGIRPDAVIVYDVSLKEAKKRMAVRKTRDRLESENDVFHKKVRKGYLAEAKKRKYKVIATDSKTAGGVFDETRAYLKKRKVV